MAKKSVKPEVEVEAVKEVKEPLLPTKGRYSTIGYVRDGSRHTTRISGDAVSLVLLGADDGELRDVLEENEMGGRLDGKTYPNAGMLRMAVGAMLRGKLNNGQSIKVKGHVISEVEGSEDTPHPFAMDVAWR
jgi:hypothetical protein